MNPSNALGAPDGNLAEFFDNNAATTEGATYSGFGAGSSITVDSADLAMLMNISEQTLLDADFTLIEYNGTASRAFESSDWLFSDGSNTLAFSYDFNVLADPVIALGNISVADYESFFGFSSIFSNGDFSFILIDIDGFSAVDVNAANLTAAISALGSTAPDSPDPDVMGRISVVPVPAALWLFMSGLTLLGLLARRRSG